ncbi:MAG: hypothetical protein LBJ59_00945 [Zoogloeaceae bacterium]|jgi:uncharacterized protein YycO|nr:hypothetical protein [Zoogloeaceae bacterium]
MFAFVHRFLLPLSALLVLSPVGAEAGAYLNAPSMALPARDCPSAPELGTQADMERALEDYLSRSGKALSMRSSAIALYQELRARKARKEALSGQDLQRIRDGALTLIEERQILLDTALAHECWLASPPAAGVPGKIQRLGVLLSLSSALMLYDNYRMAISLWQDDKDMRRHLNHLDLGEGLLSAGELRRINLMFASADNRRRVRSAIKWYRQHIAEKDKDDPCAPTDAEFADYAPACRYLRAFVEQSPSFHMVAKRRPFQVMGQTFGIFGDLAQDALFRLRRDGVHFSSLLFGNTVGLVETRRGKLYRQSAVEKEAADVLRAGDILLEKTPFRLTDAFIPGHWGHVAIWAGTEAELQELGLWEHPLVVPHQTAIRAGRGVVEALRSGVEINSLAQFLNIDDLAIVRMVDLPPEKKRAALLEALRHVGKAYDFNFDAESTDRIFCSKLIYLVYGDTDWPTSRFLNRFTISPDNIAQRAAETSGPLTPVLIYHDGRKTPATPASMAQLLAGERGNRR